MSVEERSRLEGVYTGQRDRQGMSQRRSCDRLLTIYSQLWPGSVANEELDEKAAHDHVCVI